MEEQHGLVLSGFVRFRKEPLTFLCCSHLLSGDLLRLVEDPGNSKDGELH